MPFASRHRCSSRRAARCGPLWAPLAVLALVVPVRAADDEDEAFFEARVRPVLVARCLKCHGPAKQESGLRVDSRAALLTGGASGPAIEPGQPDESLLVQAIRYDSDPQMPPSGKLSAQEREALAEWVRRGAPWPQAAAVLPDDPRALGRRHWAFQPPLRRPLPKVRRADWPRTPVDLFILARLESQQLAPSPEADRTTLLRRATFDLWGLPPTPLQRAEFLGDPEPDAYERLVERLLASPHYGQRWGRHWLDVARYADTKGYVFFEESGFPWAYTYRDYVVEALNADLPYDRFLLEQLAADQLDLGRDRRQLRALGFLTLGGRFMNVKPDILDDRIDVICRGLLGLTVTCARCHDHKYDPIPTADYYSLYGVLASCGEPNVPPLFTDPPQTPAYAAFVAELAQREQKLSEFVTAKHAELVSGARRRAAEYLLAAQAAGDRFTDDFMFVTDGADLNPKMVERWQVYLRRSRRAHDPVFAPWHALAPLPADQFAAQAPAMIARLLDDSARPLNRLVADELRHRPPDSLAALAELYGQLLRHVDELWQQARGSQPAPPAALPDPDQEQLRQVLYAQDSPPNVPFNPIGDLELLPDRPAQDQLKKLLGEVETWRATGPGAPPRAMTLQDLDPLYEPRIFVRGNPNNLGPAVPRRFLSLLAGEAAPPFRRGSGRLDLAQAIVDPANPLTARVIVNRLWLHHFGRPLVTTPSDFGLRSDPPSHPDLLDFLALRLIDDGWSLKRLHRAMLLSATYRQHSGIRADAAQADPENRLLWRMNGRRLDFEPLRDALLSVAGQLDPSFGGPPVNVLAPPYPPRRSIYGQIDRMNLPGLLRAFDYPSPDATSPQRDVTTVPAQALFLWNHPLVLELPQRLLARPDIASQPDDDARLAAIYELAYSRPPRRDERDAAREFLAAGPDGAAAWRLLVQTLLMANEFSWVD